MFDLISIGDTKLDTFVVLNDASLQCQLKMPECLLCVVYGAKIVVDAVDSQTAGTAPNVATGIARMGKKTAVISNMGKDDTRQIALRTLKREGVSTKYIHEVPNEHSAYSVVLNFKGEKTLLTSHIQHAYRFPKPVPRTKWIFVGEMGHGYETMYRQVIALEKNDGIQIALNPGTIQIREKNKFLYDLIKYTKVLFVNVEEAQAIAGLTTTEIHQLAAALSNMGAKQVVITDGKNGAYGFDGARLRSCSAFPGTLVEATGAGDAFATGYVGALMAGLSMDEALRWGAVNSASVIGYVGPTRGLLSATQIRTRLKKHPGFKTKPM